MLELDFWIKEKEIIYFAIPEVPGAKISLKTEISIKFNKIKSISNQT